ncbi:c-type cytochrome [bacterium]|nr:c-type cytochrome [bacterium]
MKLSTPLIYTLLALTLVPGRLAIGANSPGPDTGNPDRGAFIFAAYCASCHGDSGQGDGPMAPRLMRDFNVKPADLTQTSWQNSRSNKEMVQIIRQGGRSVHRTAFMPAWASTLDPQQTYDLVAFIRELGKPAATGYMPAATLGLQQKLELGRVIYTLQCTACHGPRGKGDGPTSLDKHPPDLSRPDAFRTKTDEDLEGWAESGIYHAGVPIDPDASRWWHGPLNKDEMPALILYLRSLSLH